MIFTYLLIYLFVCLCITLSFLFLSIKLNPNYQHALLLMCTFGLLLSDLTLASAALNDLKKVPHSLLSETTVCNAGYLNACLMLLQVSICCICC